MERLLKVALIGLVSGIAGTGTGGLAAFLIKKTSNRVLCFILEFSAGLMTAVVCFELIPEGFKQGGFLFTFLGMLTGILAIALIEEVMKGLKFSVGEKGNPGLLRAGILMSIGIAVHNFPEGFAVGSGFQASTGLGITITAVIIIHDIPEGIAMAVPMRAGGFSKPTAFFYTIMSGVPMGLGALLGAVLGEISPRFISSCLGFAGGAMLYVIFGELIPQSKRMYLGRLSSLANIAGIICGIMVSASN